MCAYLFVSLFLFSGLHQDRDKKKGVFVRVKEEIAPDDAEVSRVWQRVCKTNATVVLVYIKSGGGVFFSPTKYRTQRP